MFFLETIAGGFAQELVFENAAGKAVTFAYDALNKTSRTDSENRVTTYGYDLRERLKTVSYGSQPADNLTYAYDAAGNLLSTTLPNDATGVRDVAYSYDGLNRVLTETLGRAGRAVTHAYAYDLAGNRTKTTYGATGRILENTYDAHNRLITLTETGNETRYGYDRAGNVSKKQLPNGDLTETTYDTLNRAIKIATRNINNTVLGTLQSYEHDYDALGNLVYIKETSRTGGVREIENTYDKNNRLIREQCKAAVPAASRDTHYAYDAANNRTCRTVNGAATDYSYNALNQLTGTTGAEVSTYTYDLAGNRRTRTGAGTNARYAYDQENRLTSLTDATGTYAYAYDYRIRRVTRNENSITTRVLFSGGTSCSEYVGASLATPVVENIRGSDMGGGIGGLLYTVRAGVPSYTHYNSRGYVTAKTNTAGTATYTAQYEAFGKRTLETGSTTDRQRANTKDEDPTGLLNEGYRYRDLETGTFLTRDPAGFIDGPNLYAYVVQNPWTSIDPEGLEVLNWSLQSVPQDASAEKKAEIEKSNAWAKNQNDLLAKWSVTPTGSALFAQLKQQKELFTIIFGENNEYTVNQWDARRNKATQSWSIRRFAGFENEKYQQHDDFIMMQSIGLHFNPSLYSGGGNNMPTDIDPLLVKAWLIQETGGSDKLGRSQKAWPIDPAQINVPGDWNKHKADLGLTYSDKRNSGTAQQNICAAVKYLTRKGYGTSGQPLRNNPTGTFDGWEKALERYNGRSDITINGELYRVNYKNQIIARYKNPDLNVGITLPKPK